MPIVLSGPAAGVEGLPLLFDACRWPALGLAICKGIIEEHGGRIWAQSKGLGCGTTVTFVLPLGADDYLSKSISASVLSETVGRLITWAERRQQDAEAEQAAAQLLAAQSAAGGRAERIHARILIVEDHPINLELMMELLERGGMSCTHAQMGAR